MVNLPYGNDSVPEDKQEIIWGRVQDAVETLMKEGEQQKDGKGKEVVDEEGVSSVRTEGSGGSGSGGSRPGFGGRMTKLQTFSLSRISKFGPKKRWTRIELSRGNNTWTDCSWWIRILWCGGRRMLQHFRT
jgi:hypothetical protein